MADSKKFGEMIIPIMAIVGFVISLILLWVNKDKVSALVQA